MKGMKTSLALVAAALMIMAASGTSYAYHDGGVAYCEGCHTMHNSINGVVPKLNDGTTPVKGTQFNGHTYLLRGSDQSSTCLGCHSTTSATPNGYHIMSKVSGATGVPTQRTPGGDFGWLLIPDVSGANTYGGVTTNQATHRGHNIVALDYNLNPSTVYTTAPGGTFPASSLYCSSCHDPHSRARVNSNYQVVNAADGKNVGPIIGSGSYGTNLPTTNGNGGAGEAVGVYRLLGGAGYSPDSWGGSIAFANPSPFAFAPSTYNQSEATNQVRVAYGSGMSEWCANCHTSIHNPNYPTTLEHPTGNNAGASLDNNDDAQLNITIAQAYNDYVYSGNLTGNQSTSYLSMVPFETGQTMNAANYANLATLTGNASPTYAGPVQGSNANVMCLSCHRAHASGWPYSLRWNATTSEFLTVGGAYPGVDGTTAEQKGGQYNTGYTVAQVQATFYDRPASNFATYQRSLCNKCHARD